MFLWKSWLLADGGLEVSGCLKLVFVLCAFLCFMEDEKQLLQVLKQAEVNVTKREETKPRESGKNPKGKPSNSVSPTVLHVGRVLLSNTSWKFIYSWDII